MAECRCWVFIGGLSSSPHKISPQGCLRVVFPEGSNRDEDGSCSVLHNGDLELHTVIPTVQESPLTCRRHLSRLPVDAWSTICLYWFAYSGHSIRIELYKMWSLFVWLIHVAAYISAPFLSIAKWYFIVWLDHISLSIH